MNRITLYANGIGDFRFAYKVAKSGTVIEIPVRTNHLADGINLSIFGATPSDEISIVESPSFQPKKTDDKIKIESNDVLKSICSHFRGAKIKVNKTDKKSLSGTLVGLDEFEVDNGNHKTQSQYMSLYEGGSVQRVNLTDIFSYEFVQEDIKNTVERILHEHFATIRPDSSIIKMKLKSKNDDANVIIGMTLPVAQWASEYQVRKMGEVWKLIGSAIVHNNTDQPWNNFLLACVTGIPYTMETDVAEQCVPTRVKVKVHSAKVAGGTEAPRATQLAARSPMREYAACAPAPEMAGGCAPMATNDGAVAAEVGDFTYLSPKSLQSIPSNSSAVIEVINTDLKDCREELYYNFNQDEDKSGRPQMALRFTNPLSHSLQRGPCNVYDKMMCGSDLFVGSAIMPLTKSRENRFLLHGQDTSVEVSRVGGKTDQRYTSVTIAKGVALTEITRSVETIYKVRSLKDKPCELVIEHNRVLEDKATIKSNVKVEDETATTKRYRLDIPANGTFELHVVESVVDKGKLEFSDLSWYKTAIIDQEHPAFKRTNGIEECLKIQKDLAGIDSKINVLNTELNALVSHQKELRANIDATKGSSHQTNFQNQLADNDKRIMEIKKVEMPKLANGKEEIQQRLYDALQKVVLSWNG